MIIENKAYCVYGHRTESAGLFYIGCGRPGRALEWRGRSDKWHQIMFHSHVFDVQFFHFTDSKDEAMRLEWELIKKHQPAANVSGTPNRQRDHPGRASRLSGRDWIRLGSEQTDQLQPLIDKMSLTVKALQGGLLR